MSHGDRGTGCLGSQVAVACDTFARTCPVKVGTVCADTAVTVMRLRSGYSGYLRRDSELSGAPCFARLGAFNARAMPEPRQVLDSGNGGPSAWDSAARSVETKDVGVLDPPCVQSAPERKIPSQIGTKQEPSRAALPWAAVNQLYSRAGTPQASGRGTLPRRLSAKAQPALRATISCQPWRLWSRAHQPVAASQLFPWVEPAMAG